MFACAPINVDSVATEQVATTQAWIPDAKSSSTRGVYMFATTEEADNDDSDGGLVGDDDGEPLVAHRGDVLAAQARG